MDTKLGPSSLSTDCPSSPGLLNTDNPFNDIARAPTPVRKSHESSPSASLYSADGESLVCVSPDVKEFGIYHTRSRFNLRIVRGDSPSGTTDPKRDAEFYVDNSTFTPGKPDVTLIRGSEKGGEVVAVVKFSSMWRHLTIGFGDPKAAKAAAASEGWQFESVTQSGAFKTQAWTFSLECPALEGREEFMWKRTRDESIGAKEWGSKKLVRKETGEMVAVFGANGIKSWKKMGRLRILKDYGGNWELVVLCSLLGLIEQHRRWRRISRAGD